MILTCNISNQKFDKFIFAKIKTKKLIFTFNFSSVLFRLPKSGWIFGSRSLGEQFGEFWVDEEIFIIRLGISNSNSI